MSGLDSASGRDGTRTNLTSALVPPDAPDTTPPASQVSFTLDGRAVTVDGGGTLLDALREQLGIRSAKDGCSPQGQCGCCTVLVDGQPRVSCVTPVRRIEGRAVVTVDGLDAGVADGWARSFCDSGGSQCGFCTPGIVLRLEGLRTKSGAIDDRAVVDRALAAHLCRCTGWQTIREAAVAVATAGGPARVLANERRDPEAARQRATIEGGVAQRVGPDVALGRGGFADDTAPAGALVAVPDGDGGWAVGETLAEARTAAAKVQGRRTTIGLQYPIEIAEGEWALTLQTTWVEPGYLETDAAWCEPGGEPSSPLANGGAFGGKIHSPIAVAARQLADQHGRVVRALWSREDVVRLGPKRPPLAIGVRDDGSGVVRVARTPGLAALLARIAPELIVEEVDIAGPPTSIDLRGAGWAEVAAIRAGLAGQPLTIEAPSGGRADAEVTSDLVRIRVACGDPLDETVLRSYCIGAAHMALGWVRSEALRVDGDGVVHDLTIRSFGILRAAETPDIEVVIERSDGPPVNGSDAVFAAVAAAAWLEQGLPPRWPTQIGASP